MKITKQIRIFVIFIGLSDSLYANTDIRVLLEKEHQIKTFSLERYVSLVVSKELPKNWPLEAKKAQAIASRSYALAQKNIRKKNSFDVTNSVSDQVLSEGTLESSSEKATKETKGIVLLEEKTHRIPISYFHARCGGKTELPENAWGGTKSPYTSVNCPFCLKNPFHWKAKITFSELKQRLGFTTTLKKIIFGENFLGRVSYLRFLTFEKEFILPSEKLREKLGREKIKSAHFEIASQKEGLVFSGVGFGHGVGLCQWGAKYLAESGYSAEKILKHYFPSFQLKKLNE